MEMTPGQPFTLGVNYWPRRKAMYWWSQFDEGEVLMGLSAMLFAFDMWGA